MSNYYNYDGTGVSSASETRTPDFNLPTFTEPLGTPGTARALSAGSSSMTTTLTDSISRISIRAVGADIRFDIGAGTVDAANGHFIADGERLDFAVPFGAKIAVKRDGTDNGTLELTELV